MGITTTKGNLGVGKIVADVLGRGYRVAFPLGEDWPFDIIVLRGNKLERVQCKYTESDGQVVEVRCKSASDWVQYKYTKDMIDWIAAYDKTTETCYYIPAEMLGDGKALLSLRLKPAKNGQKKGVRMADEFRLW